MNVDDFLLCFSKFKQSKVSKVLSVVVAEVSALLNSRPVTHLSVNIEDPEPLTPNHFLFAQVLPYFPLKKTELSDIEVSNTQFTQSQEIVQHSWKRWMQEYVPHLTEREKWTKQQLQLQVGDLVLVVDNNSPRGQWPLGRVVETIPSKAYGVVRQVKVHITTVKNHLIRPIVKLCLLATRKELRQPTGNIEDRPEKVKSVKDIVKSDTR